ncbi:MAG: exosome complex protein Rrp42 [Candidatus Altiarchaeales archaeon]|nr:exosome complex protein Rrp42 [Candidatus Altiarchaeales archaeon]
MDVKACLTKDHIRNLAEKGQRIDGRGNLDIRQITCEKDYADQKAPGSALVNLGDTKVLVGISMDVGEPYSDRPNSGVMTTTAEFRPMASPDFESGPPRENAIELARVVDRGIRESNAIDLEKLYIEDDKVWIVFIDVHIMDNNGNLIDASGLAAAAALSQTRLPKYEDGQVIRGEWEGKLPLNKIPLPLTASKIRDQIMLDPALEEEYAQDARLTVATAEGAIHAMQKGGEGRFTTQEVEQIIDSALEKTPSIRKTLDI